MVAMTGLRLFLRRVLANSRSVRWIYGALRPAMLADSGWPSPVVRWQSEQARTSGFFPVATTVGIGAGSLGNQSAGAHASLAETSLYCLSLPGTLRTLLASRGGAPGGLAG